jgi:pimeloyl-ACP methyl ester carboxylesterase
MSAVHSADGTGIAFERFGAGDPLIVIDGAIAYAEVGPSRKLAAALADRFTAYRYDRRGRGASGDTRPYSVAREVDDIAALVEHAGGRAALVGISSGAVLALEAADAGVSAKSLVLYEPPFIIDTSRKPFPADYRQQLDRLLIAGDKGGAVKLFMRQVGLPGPLVAMMPLFPAWKKLQAVAPTLAYDAQLMGDLQAGEPLPAHRWESVQVRTLVASGAKSPAWLQRGADVLAQLLPNAARVTVAGASHAVQADRVAPVIAEFLRGEKP